MAQKAVPVQDEPIFRAAHGAMKFALNFRHDLPKASSLAAMMGGAAKRIGRGLGGLDGAGQAGMIQAEMLRLPEHQQHILVARLVDSPVPCACRQPCCCGYRPEPRWARAVDGLTGYVLSCGLAGRVSHYHLRRALVVRYFSTGRNAFIPEQQYKIVSVAAKCGVHRDTASLYNKRVVEHLREQERQAWERIDGLLLEARVIQ